MDSVYRGCKLLSDKLNLQPRAGSGTWAQRMLIIAAVMLTPAVGCADAYLDALNSAAGGLEVDPVGEKVTAASKTGDAAPSSGGETLPAGMSKDGFERFLRKRFFGSFAFYEKLDKAGKNKVFKAYGSRPDMEYVREQIKRQYLSR